MKSRRAVSVLALGLLFAGVQVGRAQNVGNELQPDPQEANTRVGTRGANFLEIGVGARGLALAGAGATLQPGVFAMYWNPAGIAATEGFGAGFSYAALYDQLNIDYFYAGGLLQFAGGAIGLAWASLSSGDITRTTEDFPAGGDPVFGSTFNWTSSFVGVYYARQITDRLNVGGGVKFISEGIDEASADWVAFDAGVTFRTGLYGIELGATAQNIGTEATFEGAAVDRIVSGSDLFAPVGRQLETSFDTRTVQLPTLFRFTLQLDVLGGPESLVQVATPDHGLNAALDITDAVDSDVQSAVGIEYNFRRIAFLRAGKRFFNENQRTGAIQRDVGASSGEFFRQSDFRDFSYGLSFGGGIRIPLAGRSIAFDYAYVNMGELENVQVLSFEFGL